MTLILSRHGIGAVRLAGEAVHLFASDGETMWPPSEMASKR
jgi:hypothetical protein